MVKKSLYLLLGLSIILCSGCKKALTTSFNVTDSESIEIPPSAVLILPSIFSSPFNTSTWQATYSNNNTDKNHITQFKLNSLVLTITSPQGKTFGFVKDIDIYLQAPNLPDIEIAYIHGNPTTSGSTISLTPENVDLSAYAKADSFTLRVETTEQQNNTDTVDITADMSFHVVANVL